MSQQQHRQQQHNQQQWTSAAAVVDRPRLPEWPLRSRSLALGIRIFLAACAAVTVRSTHAIAGDVLFKLQLVSVQQAQIIAGPGNSHAFWAAASIPSSYTSIFSVSLSSNGTMSITGNASYSTAIDLGLLYYSESTGVAPATATISLIGILAGAYQAVAFQCNWPSLNYNGQNSICYSTAQPLSLPVNALLVSSAGSRAWQALLCPDGRQRVRCSDPNKPTRTSSSMTGYSAVGNGTLLLVTFVDGLGSMVCMYSVADVNGGNQTVSAIATFPRSTVVSMAVFEQTPTKSIVFLSASNGSIFRSYLSINMQSKNYLMYDMIGFSIPGSGVQGTNITFIDNKLIVPVANMLYAVDTIDECNYITCSDCVTWKYKSCGWCYSTSSCTAYTKCPVGWIPANPIFTPSCPGPDTINPNSAAIGSSVSVFINGTGAQPGSRCSFSKVGVVPFVSTTKTTSTATILQCTAPNASYFSTNGTFTVMFSLYYSDDPNVIYGAADFTYVDCSIQNSCSSCLRAHRDCAWCRNEQVCIFNAASTCPSQDPTSIVISADINKCPAIKEIGPRMLPCMNTSQTIRINISDFPAQDKATYECRITGIATTLVSAKQSGPSLVTCEAPLCTVSTSQFQTVIGVTLWRDDKIAVANMGDAPANITLYNCNIIQSCFDCVRQQNAGFGCVWCPDNTCSFSSCSDWHNMPGNCTSLNIDNTTMNLSSPVDGSNFTLFGWGLGNGSFQQVKDSISIKGLPCPVSAYNKLSDQYDRPDRIVCRVAPSSARGSVGITITIEGVTWQSSFYYFDPEITSVEKSSYGLVSGGTQSLIHGLDFNYLNKSSHSVYLKSPLGNETQINSCIIPESSSALMYCTMPIVTDPGNYSFVLKFYGGLRRDFAVDFTYYPDPNITAVQPQQLKGTISGGQKVTIIGRDFLGIVDAPRINLTVIGGAGSKRSLPTLSGVESPCNVTTASMMICMIPNATSVVPHSLPATLSTTLKIDQVIPILLPDVTIYPDPNIYQFAVPLQYTDNVVLEGSDLIQVYSQNDYSVFVGGLRCKVNQPSNKVLVFTPPTLDQLENSSESSSRIFNITVIVDHFTFKPGFLSYLKAGGTAASSITGGNQALIIGISCGGIAAVAIILVAAFLYRRKAKYHQRQYRKSMQQLNQMEVNVRNECKQAFAELQADMTNLTNDMVVTGIPYWDYGNFTYKILFPGSGHSQSLSRLTTKSKGNTVLAMNKFELLVCSRSFLILFIHTLEEQEAFSIADRVSVASLVMLILQNKMDYATLVLKDLLSHLIRAKVKKTNAKLLLRSSESVVERMLTHWLSLCLYKYIQDFAGMPMFLLFKAIKQQIEKGPVDSITQEARYSLSEERLLREKVDAQTMTLSVIQDFSNELLPCKVLDCDTISQVKEKILDALHRNMAYSLRPSAMDYLLVWRPSLAEIPLADEDSTSEIVAGWKKLNTLAHYSVPDNAVVELCLKSASLGTRSSRKSKGGGSEAYLLPLHSSHMTTTERHSTVNKWHLSKHRHQTLPKEKRQETMVSEIFLTRLVKTKGTLQEFIDKLFATIFSCDRLPPVIKFLFDFLDDEYKACGINDPEVLHIWKNNSLHLRFWINLIKNPDFVFDVSKSQVMDSCLTVVAQTLIDSCSITESDYGADAPVNKLLFAKDRPRYRKMVEKFYADVHNQPPTSEQELNIYLNTISSMYPKDFYRSSALQELYSYAKKYMPQLMSKLCEEGGQKNHQVRVSLLHINEILDSVHHHDSEDSASVDDTTMYSFV